MFEAGLNEAGERDRREPLGEAAGSPLWRTKQDVFEHLHLQRRFRLESVARISQDKETTQQSVGRSFLLLVDFFFNFTII